LPEAHRIANNDPELGFFISETKKYATEKIICQEQAMMQIMYGLAFAR
jgi:hypothetical protein